MPSFTLLGEQIIRFPFILESSYPHEILHNWWGNSVYPDYATGNWSEGLTAYLADHLFRAINGTGHEYRKEMLARYKNYVSEASDFSPVQVYIEKLCRFPSNWIREDTYAMAHAEVRIR